MLLCSKRTTVETDERGRYARRRSPIAASSLDRWVLHVKLDTPESRCRVSSTSVVSGRQCCIDGPRQLEPVEATDVDRHLGSRQLPVPRVGSTPERPVLLSLRTNWLLLSLYRRLFDVSVQLGETVLGDEVERLTNGDDSALVRGHTLVHGSQEFVVV